MTNKATYYELLGVDRTAGHDEIRRAYIAAARRWHPDRNSGAAGAGSDKAERAMQRVNEAWTVLGDNQRRKAYDLELSGGRPTSTTSTGVRTGADGVTRVDPRLLDPAFLTARRQNQLDELSTRNSFILRAAPLVAVVGLLGAIFVFTAYARSGSDVPPATTVPGPQLGAGIEANDCVDVITGPALLEVPCTATADGRVIGARLPDGFCPTGTDSEAELSNGAIVCLDGIRS